jgi:hypothetical protein
MLLWSCRLTGEEKAFLQVKADSTWTAYDEVMVILAQDGHAPDTLFQGKLSNPSQLGKLPAPGYDGGQAEVILVGLRNGKPVKRETRYYDGRTQTETGPNVVVDFPEDPGGGNPGGRKAPVVRLGDDSVVSVNAPVRVRGTASDSDGTIAKLEWSIGGGTFIPGSGDTTLVPAAPGTLPCVLRATDNDGLTSSDTLILTISPSQPPSITGFSPADTTISIRDSVAFTARASGSSPLSAFSWDFDGDGMADESGTLSGTAASLKSGKRFPSPGSYTVNLKVSDQSGIYQFKQGRVIVEYDPPKAGAGKDTAVAAGTRIDLHGTATDRLGTVAKREWKIGSGSYSPAPAETSFTAPATGGFVLVCVFRVTDDDGLRDSDEVLVSVNPAKDASLKQLSLSTGSLSPEFSSGEKKYTASVGETVQSITLTATPASLEATLKLNDTVIQAGVASGPLFLATPITILTVTITAQDGSTTASYVITVTRLDETAPDPPTVKGPASSADPRPTWTWTGSGGGDGTFRYELDDADFSSGATQTTERGYTPTSALPDGIHTLYVRERDASGNWSAFGSWRVAVAVGPVSRYNFDGDVRDAGPNANHGRVEGTVSYVADRLGVANRAVSFQAGNGAIFLGSASINPGTSFTVSAWILERDSAASRAIFSPGEESYGFRLLSANTTISGSLTGAASVVARCPIALGQWTHIACAYDGTNLRIYRNGAIHQTVEGPSPSLSWNSGYAEIGSEGQAFWKGALDELRIYNRALTVTEISAIHSGGL